MRILFIVPYSNEGQSNRLRVSQFLPYLKEKGFQYKVRPFVFRRFYNIVYLKGNYVKKVIFFLCALCGRLFDIVRLVRYDVVFVHREACPFGPCFFEWIAHKFGKKLIFDFDDAIYLTNKSRSNNFVERFKDPHKVPYIIRISDRIIAGNRFLADFASKYNKKVDIIPTCVDTDTYINNNLNNNPGRLTIGWIGSVTTIEYLNMLKNVFVKLAEKYPHLNFEIVGGDFSIDGISSLVSKKWSLERELSDLSSMDIGLMPMPDNDWTKGKCGFKALLYMSMQIPCVCSPVGVNKEIVQDGINGFLADSEEEWIEKISRLAEHPELRKKMGMAGRITVEEKFSVKRNAPRYFEVIKSMA